MISQAGRLDQHTKDSEISKPVTCNTCQGVRFIKIYSRIDSDRIKLLECRSF